MSEAESVQPVVEAYRAVLVRMDANRIMQGGKPTAWNRLVNEMQILHLRLAETREGRQAVTDLALTDENLTVRTWSAVNALRWDPAKVRGVLEIEAQDKDSINGMEAEIVLREFDSGCLNTAWIPGRR